MAVAYARQGAQVTGAPAIGADERQRPDLPHLSLAALFLRFLKFGLLAWGGPVAQIAMIKQELVEKEGWIDVPRFNRLLAVYQVLPGPEAHELCVHLGMVRAGRAGAILAGLGFMLPGLLFILLLSWGYSQIHLDAPLIGSVIIAIQVGVVALIVRAVHRIGEHVLIDPQLWAIAVAVAVATLVHLPFWAALPLAGAAYALPRPVQRRIALACLLLAAALAWSMGPGPAVGPSSPTQPLAASLPILFLSGLKAGLLTFGGAYTAIPFVRDDAVGNGWIDDGQFLDGLALSGIIPAPLIIFATFVGYVAGGVAGALAITAGIFLPAFSFTLLFFDRLERVVDDPRLNRFLAGIAAGVVGLIAVTMVQLGSTVLSGTPSLGLAALTFVLALATLYGWKSKFNTLLVVFGAGLLGTIYGVMQP